MSEAFKKWFETLPENGRVYATAKEAFLAGLAAAEQVCRENAFTAKREYERMFNESSERRRNAHLVEIAHTTIADAIKAMRERE